MGPSGTGKSTIFQLMMRLYDPDSGTVLLDGVDLKKIDLSWLRGQISYVSQEPLLFSASIRENLLIGKPTASEEELWSAMKKAEIADFVKELKEGL
jgi:ABC-type multidrug transport system fused ATPase/permease subunit